MQPQVIYLVNGKEMDFEEFNKLIPQPLIPFYQNFGFLTDLLTNSEKALEISKILVDTDSQRIILI